MDIKRETIDSQEKKQFIPQFDLQSLITVFYVSIVVIGMIFNNFKYGIFNINIFEHSDIFDFLIAPLGDLRILFFTFLTLLGSYIYFKFDKSLGIKYPSFYNKMYLGMVNKPWFKTALKIQWVGFVVVYLVLTAMMYSIAEQKRILKSEEKIEIDFMNGTKFSGKKIGANTSFQFMLDDSLNIRIIPTSAIKNIIRLKKKKE